MHTSYKLWGFVLGLAIAGCASSSPEHTARTRANLEQSANELRHQSDQLLLNSQLQMMNAAIMVHH